MNQLLHIRRKSAGVQVAADAATLDWVRVRSGPYFDVEVSTEAGASWLVAGGLEHAPGAADFEPQEIIYPSGERCRVFVSRSSRLLVVDLPPGPWRRLYVLRMVRNLLRWELQSAGPLYLHGVAMTDPLADECICVLGPSGSGKSTLSYRMAQMGWRWLTQDDICLLEERPGQWTALGWPGALRLRRSALSLFPELPADEAAFTHPANVLEAALPSHTAFLRIFPEELVERLPTALVGEARVVAFLILDGASSSTTFESVAPVELALALHAAWDVLPERRAGAKVADALVGRRPWDEMVFNPRLLQAFGAPSLERLERSLASLSRAAPAWRIGRETWPHLVGSGGGMPWQAAPVAGVPT